MMGWIYRVYIVNPGDRSILVEHVFYSPHEGTKEECLGYYNEHLGTDSYLQSAARDGRTAEEWEQIPIDEMPEADTA
jgi:hypothetical protein